MKTKLKIFILIFFSLIGILCSQSLIKNNETRVSAAERTNKTVSLQSNTTSTEIQNLLDMNKYNEYNLTVQIPSGQYYLYKELRIYSNTTILAAPDAKFIKNHEKGSMIANDLSNDNGGYTAASNITISGGIWDSVNATKGTESFRFIHATNITIQNATICNVPEGSKLILLAGVKNSKVDGCKLFGYTGIWPKEAIQLDIVHDNVLVPSMQEVYLHYDDLACDGIVISNNEIYNYPRAIGSHSSVKGVFHKNITISGNNLHDIDEAAIKAFNYINVLINNNTITNASVGVLAYTNIDDTQGQYIEPLPSTTQEPLPSTYNIRIEGNIIKNMYQFKSGNTLIWGDGIRIMGSKDRPLTGVSTIKNKIYDTKRIGIFVSDAPDGYIGNNYITKTTSHGIYIDKSPRSKAYYNYLSWPGKAGTSNGGIGFSASNNSTAYKNTVKDAAKNGIFLYNASVNCSISTNTIVRSADNGVSVILNSNNAKISYNKITGKPTSTLANRGIFVYGANYATVRYNTITDCKLKQEINTYSSVGSKVYGNKIN
jgi:hypothetical protein